MDFSVVIPTLARPEHLARCLACLREQSPVGGEFEVIVVLDGPDAASAALCRDFDARGRFDLRVIEAERRGNAHTKNRGIAAASGDYLVLLNDDVRPVPRFLQHHLEAHAERDGHAAVVVGYSPWVVHQPESVFDRLLRSTSMVFFYDKMVDEHGVPRETEGHDWGFRHAWTLNLSVRTELVREVEGFDESLANCCFEDVEFAWRFTKRFDAPVLFRADAVAEHDHRYEPSGYLAREFRLGYSAWGLAVSNPACAREIFRGRDLTSAEVVERTRREFERDGPLVEGWRAWFESLAVGAQGASLDEGDATGVLGAMYERHLPLKRHEFRRGLLAAAEGKVIEGLFPASSPILLNAAATIRTDAQPSRNSAGAAVRC